MEPTYQEYATNEYNRNKKVLRPNDLKEVVNVKGEEVIEKFKEAVQGLNDLACKIEKCKQLNKKLSTGKKTTIDIRREGRENKEFSIVKNCPLGLPYYVFAIESLFVCSDELKAFDYWIGYATKIELFDAIRYAVDEGFYTNEKITAIIYKILEKHA